MLLLESPRHSPGVDWDLSREVHRAEWRMKEQKLQDDIKTLREKLLLLVRNMRTHVAIKSCYVTDVSILVFLVTSTITLSLLVEEGKERSGNDKKQSGNVA